MTQRQKLFLITGILLLAAFFRFYRLNELPPGLHYDEAFNAVEAKQVLAGTDRPIYFTGDLTEEPMAIYAASVFFWLFGASPFSLRLVSAFVGILTVAAIYFLARFLAPSPLSRSTGEGTGVRVGVLAAFILAILYWHVNFSRLGMELIFLPLMLTLGMGFWMRARSLPPLHREGGSRIVAKHPQKNPLLFPTFATMREGWGRWALAGIFFALTQYTYKAALFVPIFFVAFLATELFFNREFFSRNWRGLGIFLAIAVLVFAPLGLYWATHPSEFIERPSTVLATPATYIQNAIKVGAMFFLRGDDNPRSNLPGRSVLDPFLAIGFIVGIGVCLVRFKRVESRVLLIWLAAMLLPSILTDFAPHFGRSIGAIPAVAIITAVGFDAIWVRAKHSLNLDFLRIKSARARQIFSQLGLANPCTARKGRCTSPLLLTLYVLLFAFSTFSTFNDYFVTWGTNPGLFESFDAGLLSLAQKLRARPPDETLFLSPVERDHYTVQFGLNGADANSFDGARVLVLPAPGTAAAYGILTRNDSRSLARLQKIYPSGRVVDRVNDFAGQPYAVIYRADGAAQWTPQHRVDARLGDNIALIAYDAARDGSAIALTIYWGSLAETREDETVFVHVLDAAGRVVAQDDARPGHGSYLTTRWKAGQVIADDYVLTLPPGSRGDFQIEIGMYVLETGARARVTDASGAHMENDRVLVERFTYP